MRRSEAGAANLDAAEGLAADGFEEALEKSRWQRIGKLGAGFERRNEGAVLQAGDDEAVLGGVGEIGGEQSPALSLELPRGEREARLQRLIGEHGLTETREFEIERRGKGVTGRDATGVLHGRPGAGFVGVKHSVHGLQECRGGKHDPRAIGDEGDAGRRVEAGTATFEEAAEGGGGFAGRFHFFQGIFAALAEAAGAAGFGSRLRRRMASCARPD